ncbi:sensor histidine kinase [Amycolatopsis minnesotensis]|uniref:sensor histidine kinase n=1 Tax=Amycolatopsis minnesotensis TaxID=337894 RepID=UPI0031D5B62E
MNGTSTTGILEDEEPFVHPALFYRGEREFLDGTVPFLEAGLAAGEPVAAALPEQNLKVLRAALGATARRVHLVDMTEAGRNPARIIPGVLRAFADAHPGHRVRIIGEPIWPGRSETEYPACAQHEALINLAFAGRTATILCPYDAAGLDDRVLDDAHATHPVVIGTDGPRPSGRYDPGRIVAGYNRPLPEPVAATRITVDVTNLVEARRLVTAHARHAGLDERRTSDLELAASELAENSIAHGGGSGVLRIWTDDTHLVCEVHDAGTLTDPLAGRHPASPRQLHGRGLLLVNQIADLVRVHTGPSGTTTRIHLRLP